MTRDIEELLHLDPEIRDWVVIPMFLMLILVGMARNYVQILIKSDTKISESELNGDHRYKQNLFYSQRLRMNGCYLNVNSYNKKKLSLLHKENGLLNEKLPSTPANPMMSNPNMMMDMIKGNMVFMIPNIVMMTFVSSFFAGFLCLKLPFTLPSNRFKLMLQRDIDLKSLDVSYVSSLSW